jgi:tartrate dehydratase alpha subunit/fumarate hydratase class I-like protein
MDQVALSDREREALETLRQHGLGPLGWGGPKASLGVLEAAAHAAGLWSQYEARRKEANTL